MIRGTPVTDEQSQQTLGLLSGILPEPDTGAIVGFFVATRGFGHPLFLQSSDILSWGTRVHVRDADRLAPAGELIRVAKIIEYGRPVLGQRIVAKSGAVLGTCSDVQFDTRHFQLEWLFPKRFFLERLPIPASDILEVTKYEIVVRDPLKPKPLADAIGEEAVKVLGEVAPSAPAAS